MADPAAELATCLERFAELLPEDERRDLRPFVAASNAYDPLRIERSLPVTVLLTPGVHPSYFSDAPWRVCFTDGGPVGPGPVRDRMLDEAIRLAEAMHDKNPFGEVGFDGGKTVVLQDAAGFQALTVLYGDIGMSRLILAKGGIRYYASGDVSPGAKRDALTRWAASSVLAGVLARRYIGGPDMRMGPQEMAWIQQAAQEVGTAQRVAQHAAVTGLDAQDGGFPHEAWELTGRTVVASLKEALRHPGMSRYGVDASRPIRVLIHGFGDVGGSVARLLVHEAPDFTFLVCGVADEWGAIYRGEGLDPGLLLGLRPVGDYAGPVDSRWTAADAREVIFQDADVLVPAAIPNIIDAESAPRLRARIVAEGANNAVAPGAEQHLAELGILYLPGQALNWGGVKASTLEALFRELTKRSAPFEQVEASVRPALSDVDVSWALEILRSWLSSAPLPDLKERRAFAIAVLEDLARSNTRWLCDELVASNHLTHPIELVRATSRRVRALKVQMLSLIEAGLGREFFDAGTTLHRRIALLDHRLRELLFETGAGSLTATQVTEQRQMLQQLQTEVLNGLSPGFACLLAALDLARQKVMDPDGYSQPALRRDLATLRSPDAAIERLEASLHRLQRVHPGPDRPDYASALAALLADAARPVVIRRNAAMALGKLGTGDPEHFAILVSAAGDPDASVRAACKWALYQMAATA